MLKTEIMRPAIAMLELIFAIVIMGIILMSAPMLISTASKSGYVAIQQEAINEAASQVNLIMGYQWDENDVNDEYIDPILNVSNGHGDLDEAVPTGRRLGTPEESYRAFVRSDGVDDLAASTTLGTDTGDTENDDIDDFEGDSSLVLIQTSTVDYIEDETTININTDISYNVDSVTGGYNQSNITFNPLTDSGGTTNIKSITVELTNIGSSPEELDKKIILRGFSCNIGGYKLEEKDVN